VTITAANSKRCEIWGAFPADADLDVLERDIDATAIPIGSKLPSMQTVAGTIRANLQMMIRHHFRLPTLLVLLSKNLLFANDTLQRYAPDMDLLGETGPFILQTLMEMQSNEP
jgi:predicted unusual protein kinase regulating ubiquinone biosynthesis (AarF/ABC1/UbiB family)